MFVTFAIAQAQDDCLANLLKQQMAVLKSDR